MRILIFLVTLITVGVLGGCSSTSSCAGNPATDSVFCAGRALSSGAYEGRLEKKTNYILELQNVVTTEKNRYAALEKRTDNLKARNAALKNSISRVLSEADRLIAKMRTRNLEIAACKALLRDIIAYRERLLDIEIRLDAGTAENSYSVDVAPYYRQIDLQDFVDRRSNEQCRIS